MNLRNTTIGESTLFIADGNYSSKYPKKDEFLPDGVPFVSSNNLKDGRIVWENMKFISPQQHASLKKGHLIAGDVLLVTRGNTIGASALVTPAFSGANINAQLVLLRADNKSIDPEFLHFTVSSQRFFDSVLSFASGTAQPQLPVGALKKIPISFPHIDIQCKIASILSAYDDLIENNTRRIAILEEMAQAIYREWFVHFRFPGHKTMKLIDSPLGRIPEAWSASVLKDHLAALETGKRPKGGAVATEGVPSVGAENVISIGRHNYDSEKFVSRDYFDQMTKGVVKDRDVALYKDGAYIGRSTYFRGGFPHREFCVNEHVFLLRSNGNRITQNILYLWLQEPNTVQAIRATNANAAQPGINQKGLSSIALVAPTAAIAEAFDSQVEPMLHTIITLAKKNQVLRRTRDLLMPKLISGQLDVEDLDIETGEPLVEAVA